MSRVAYISVPERSGHLTDTRRSDAIAATRSPSAPPLRAAMRLGFAGPSGRGETRNEPHGILPIDVAHVGRGEIEAERG
jgi:hypothetical protein